MTSVQHHRLDNGVRVVLEPVAGSASASIQASLLVGSRHEPLRLGGATHFLEHLLFKGTARRDLHAIAREINLQGGGFDASTSTDSLRLANRVVVDDVPRCLALMDELLYESEFPEAEIERERGVVLEEIAECSDSPEDLAYDNFLAQMWLPDPLGRPILGEPEVIESVGREDLLGWWAQAMQPGSLMVSIAGGIDCDEVLGTLNETLGARKANGAALPRPEPATPNAGIRTVRRDLEQVQFCIGYGALGSADDRRFALAAIDTIFGASTGSRLFTEIRERHGLAYTIASTAHQLLDEGYLMIYGSTTSANLVEVRRKIDEQVTLFCGDGPTQEELEIACMNHERGYLLALESNNFRAGRNAARLMHGMPDLEDREMLEKFRAVTRDDAVELAREIFRRDAAAVSLVGPVGEAEAKSLSA